MRIFAAIDISEHTRLEVSKYAETLRNEFPKARAAWTRIENLHLTLKFFGDASGEQLDFFTDAVAAAAKKIAPFDVQIEGAGAFPSSAGNARVLWLGLREEQGNLRRLNEFLEAECEARGLPRERREFNAHLTIARIREPRSCPALAQKHLHNQFQAPAFTAKEIIVYRSELQPKGSIYTALSKHKLKNS
jgi:2'-5' RNA ligase